MLLEICSNQSLMDMLRRRKRFTEPESRLLIMQILGAVRFMHCNRVIHRDLKLGNVFLDQNMNVKIGDFGLAAFLQHKHERKRTICGTPNYIAPEVLFGKDQGHSFEVDIWSVGIILYAMLFGKPPFQSKEVDTIYRRIKHNDYEFPSNIHASDEAKDLIKLLLHQDPLARPTLLDITNHEFFKFDFPPNLSIDCLDGPPDYGSISALESKRNLDLCKMNCLLIQPSSSRPALSTAEMIRQESNLQGHVLPESLSPASTKEKYKMVIVPPHDKLSSNSKQAAVAAVTAANPRWVRSGSAREIGPARRSSRLLLQDQNAERDNAYSQTKPPRPLSLLYDKTPASAAAAAAAGTAFATTGSGSNGSAGSSTYAASSRLRSSSSKSETPRVAELQALNSLKVISNTITAGLARSSPKISPEAMNKSHFYIVKWVDYTNRYGLSYEMSNGMVGVLFNDNVTLLYNTAFKTHSWVQKISDSWFYKGEISSDSCDEKLSKKLRLVTMFHDFMQNNLSAGSQEAAERATTVRSKRSSVQHSSCPFLIQFTRVRDVFVFHLSNGIIQFNFPDHCKVILSCEGTRVDYLDDRKSLYTWSIAEAVEKIRGGKNSVRSKLERCASLLDDHWMVMLKRREEREGKE